MSLISDPDYIIHALRLRYLRSVEDPYGPRIISLNPRLYESNAHIIASGLADVERWPELAAPLSPLPGTENALANAEGGAVWPGARLKHTQTILGPSRAGLAGMRVTGKRESSARDRGGSVSRLMNGGTAPIGDVVTVPHRTKRSDSEPIPPARPSNISALSRADTEQDPVEVSGFPSSVRSSTIEAQPQDEPVAVQRIPSARRAQTTAGAFEGAVRLPRPEEMEGRRRPRLRAHFSSSDQPIPVEIEAPITPEPDRLAIVDSYMDPMSSADEGGDDMDHDEDDLLVGDPDAVGDIQDDEFDPEAVPASSSPSDSISLISANSLLSGSVVGPHSLRGVADSSMRGESSMRGRLSPVSEFDNPSLPRNPVRSDGGAQSIRGPAGTNFSLALPRNSPPGRPNPLQHQYTLEAPSEPPVSSQIVYGSDPSLQQGVTEFLRAEPVAPAGFSAAAPTTLSFSRISVAREGLAKPPARSALTAMLASQSASDNPFTELYSAIAARSEAAGMKVQVYIYFPLSRGGGRPLTLTVRKDATVEEVIGHALWTHWDNKREPRLDDGLGGDDDPKRPIRLSAVGWSLRIAEDDGEVDEDFPAPDRSRRISAFSFGAYAILEATPAQVQQHASLEAKIVRRPSRIMVAKKRSEPAAAAPGLLSVTAPNATPSSEMSSMLSGLFAAGGIIQGPQILLKIRVAHKTDDLHYMTLNVTPAMYMQEVLDMAARKRRMTDMKDANEWALVTPDMSIVIPLDRTVASLQGKTDIVLAKKTFLEQLGLNSVRQFGRSTDPNASIFKRTSEVPERQGNTVMDFTTAYKKFIVQRKLPMLIGRHERILAVDGDYIHIMPSATKAFILDNPKTSSYHAKSIVVVNQSKTGSGNFKVVVWREGGQKRYDFEAESGKAAAEIVASIKNLQKVYSGNQGANKGAKSRRSRTIT